MTASSVGAKAFYKKLMGWETRDDEIPGGVYTMLLLDDGAVGGMFQIDEAMKQQGVPSHWVTYVAVADADATVARAKELGGTVLRDAFDVMEFGRMASLQDPGGAPFSIWQAKQHTGFGHEGNTPGTVGWYELGTRDVERVGAFYADLFGWAPEPHPVIGDTMFRHGGEIIGDMMSLNDGRFDGIPPRWTLYFSVADCDASVKVARENGGEIKLGPTDMMNIGRFAVVQDPQGAVFSIMQFAERAT
jgi:hypothetical protein